MLYLFLSITLTDLNFKSSFLPILILEYSYVLSYLYSCYNNSISINVDTLYSFSFEAQLFHKYLNLVSKDI